MANGQKGPPPKPTALKILHGETRPSRLNNAEPQPGQTSVVPPDDLSEEALVIWDELADDLIRTGVLKPWDARLYGDYCEAVVSSREAQQHLDEEGEVIDYPVFNRSGEEVSSRPVVNPWWKIRREAAEAMLKGAARFGLTPADRSRLQVNQGPAKDQPSNEDLLSG